MSYENLMRNCQVLDSSERPFSFELDDESQLNNDGWFFQYENDYEYLAEALLNGLEDSYTFSVNVEGFSSAQIEVLLGCIESGLTETELALMLDKDLTVEAMKEIKPFVSEYNADAIAMKVYSQRTHLSDYLTDQPNANMIKYQLENLEKQGNKILSSLEIQNQLNIPNFDKICEEMINGYEDINGGTGGTPPAAPISPNTNETPGLKPGSTDEQDFEL